MAQTKMKAEQSVGEMVRNDELQVTERARASSIVSVMRHWVPLVLTILLVPGGVLLGVALIVRYWSCRRATALPMVAPGMAKLQLESRRQATAGYRENLT